jgi:hypothetical protein
MAKPPVTKPVTIRFTRRAYEQVRKHLLKDDLEEMCYLFAHVVENTKRRIFLVDHVLRLDPACYLRRTRTSIVLDPRAKNLVYSRFVESPYNGLINAHSHPLETGAVRFSGTMMMTICMSWPGSMSNYPVASALAATEAKSMRSPWSLVSKGLMPEVTHLLFHLHCPQSSRYRF